MEKKTVWIKTFGCQMNIRDSEIMTQKLAEQGYSACASLEEASLIVINTCSVRAKAEQKLFSLLGSLRAAKQANPSLRICVAGCVAQQEGRAIVERMPHVDLVIGTQQIYDLPDVLARAGTVQVRTDLSETYHIPRYLPDPGGLSPAPEADETAHFSRYVTIMQGCNNFCTYCVVPFTRGREVSRRAADIIDEVTQLVGAGVREIILLGQNVNSYGRENQVCEDGAPYPFSRLLRDVAGIEGLRRLRFTTSHPKDLSDDLISCFAELDNLCPQFHLPVQSGSDAILQRMNRKYTRADYLDKVDRLRAARPDLALTTDIIVGFPGETDADFQATMELLERVRYHGSFSFKYSDRPNTAASNYTDKCSEEVKSERLRIFQRRQDEISLERNQEYLDSIVDVLLESVQDDGAMGRAPTNHIVHLEKRPDASPGSFIRARVTGAGQHSLKGEPLGT